MQVKKSCKRSKFPIYVQFSKLILFEIRKRLVNNIFTRSKIYLSTNCDIINMLWYLYVKSCLSQHINLKTFIPAKYIEEFFFFYCKYRVVIRVVQEL